MKTKKGYPLPLGVSERDGYINFSIVVPDGRPCFLKLFKKDEKEPYFETKLEECVGEVHFLSVLKEDADGMEYSYAIGDKVIVDPYAKSVIENEKLHLRGRLNIVEYDWEGDKQLHIPENEIIAYSLHVRGFTKHESSGVKKKGTFAGLSEKIPYLQELGINQIQCMPVYSFEEAESYKNYWGYGPAFCFAVKNKYADGESPETELKDMIKAFHKAGIEVVLNLPFDGTVPKMLMMECLQYYLLEYHVDGFLLNPYVVPMEEILTDPLLKGTKIIETKDSYQNVMRRFLKSDAGTVVDAMWHLEQPAQGSRYYNSITAHNGFTLADLYSYNTKHNESNGESNFDGPDCNHSWNCGVEGKTDKEEVILLRQNQVRNAIFLLLTSHGVPCILAGDEFGNSQNGNNNVYCQDNETGWLNWNDLEENRELFEYVKRVIQLRKELPFFKSNVPLPGVDKSSCGIPVFSFHGEYVWQPSVGYDSRQFGVYYHDEKEEIKDIYIAYNMHWEESLFALPTLQNRKKWYRTYSTESKKLLLAEAVEEKEKKAAVKGRTIVVFVGR